MDQNTTDFQTIALSSLAITLRSKDVYHLILRNGLPKLQGKHECNWKFELIWPTECLNLFSVLVDKVLAWDQNFSFFVPCWFPNKRLKTINSQTLCFNNSAPRLSTPCIRPIWTFYNMICESTIKLIWTELNWTGE